MVMPSGRAWGETGSKRLDLENLTKQIWSSIIDEARMGYTVLYLD